MFCAYVQITHVHALTDRHQDPNERPSAKEVINVIEFERQLMVNRSVSSPSRHTRIVVYPTKQQSSMEFPVIYGHNDSCYDDHDSGEDAVCGSMRACVNLLCSNLSFEISFDGCWDI